MRYYKKTSPLRSLMDASIESIGGLAINALSVAVDHEITAIEVIIELGKIVDKLHTFESLRRYMMEIISPYVICIGFSDDDLEIKSIREYANHVYAIDRDSVVQTLARLSEPPFLVVIRIADSDFVLISNTITAYHEFKAMPTVIVLLDEVEDSDEIAELTRGVNAQFVSRNRTQPRIVSTTGMMHTLVQKMYLEEIANESSEEDRGL